MNSCNVFWLNVWDVNRNLCYFDVPVKAGKCANILDIVKILLLCYYRMVTFQGQDKVMFKTTLFRFDHIDSKEDVNKKYLIDVSEL